MKKIVLHLAFLFAGSTAFAQSDVVSSQSEETEKSEEKQGRREESVVLPAKEDISIHSAAVTVNGTGSGCYRGEVKLHILAAPAATGNYRLRVVPENAGKTPSLQIKLRKGLNELTVPEVHFPALGKNNMRLELENESGGKTIVRNYPVRIVYDPLKMTLLNPGYAGIFFPGQDFSRVEGELAIRLTAEGLTAVVSLDGDSIPGETLTFPAPGRTVKFSFDTRKMGYDTGTVTAELRKGTLIISRVQSEIRRPPTHWTRMAWVEESGITVNGKPVSPQGIYAVRYRNKLVFPASTTKAEIPLPRRDLCMLEPAWLIRNAGEEAVKDVRPSPVVFERIRKKAAEYKNKDFLFYYLCSEPEARKLSPVYLRHLYEFLKEMDVFHPVMIGSRTAREYMECADVFSFPPPAGLPENRQ